MAPYRYHVFAYYLFRLLRNHPVKTIIVPIIRPNNIPILTFLIKIPTINPIIMAKINAMSPLLVFGFLWSAILQFSGIKSEIIK